MAQSNNGRDARDAAIYAEPKQHRNGESKDIVWFGGNS